MAFGIQRHSFILIITLHHLNKYLLNINYNFYNFKNGLCIFEDILRACRLDLDENNYHWPGQRRQDYNTIQVAFERGRANSSDRRLQR